VKYDAPRGLFGRLGLVGQTTAGDDRFSPLTRERSRVVIAGSQAYNAINPTVLKVDLAAGAYLGPNVFVNAGTQIPLAGKNVATEPVFIALLGFDLGGKTRSDASTDTPRKREVPKGNESFETYTLSARVVQSNNRLKLFLIDKGRGQGIRAGEILTVFEPDAEEGVYGAAVARAKVTQAGPTRSKLQVVQYYKKQRIEEGFVVRRPVR
jgi:hypothetical protein